MSNLVPGTGSTLLALIDILMLNLIAGFSGISECFVSKSACGWNFCRSLVQLLFALDELGEVNMSKSIIVRSPLSVGSILVGGNLMSLWARNLILIAQYWFGLGLAMYLSKLSLSISRGFRKKLFKHNKAFK